MVVVGATVTGDTENGYTVTANDGMTILNISTELDTTITIVGDLTEVTVNTPNAHIVVPAGTTVTTINALSVSESSLEILGTVNEIVIKSEKTIRIYGEGLVSLKITNGLDDGEVKVILSKSGNEETVIEQGEEVEIDEDGDIVGEEPTNPTEVDVTTFEELKDAIEKDEVTTINIVNDINVTEKLQILTEKHIDGKGKTLNFVGDNAKWQGNYVLQFYKTTGSVKDIAITGGDAAIYVNGSTVTLEGTVDVSGNEFGGIEVSKGEDVQTNPKLIVKDTLDFDDENLPAIWIDGKTTNDGWVVVEDLFEVKKEEENQLWFVTTKPEETDTEEPKIDGATFTKDTDGFYILTVEASDNVQLEELEVDHSYEGTEGYPEFSVYADARDPYGDQESEFNQLGVTVTYEDGTWTINFGEVFPDDIKFYLVVRDSAGNASGSMYDGSYLTVSFE